MINPLLVDATGQPPAADWTWPSDGEESVRHGAGSAKNFRTMDQKKIDAMLHNVGFSPLVEPDEEVSR